jgi:hypothetical protein
MPPVGQEVDHPVPAGNLVLLGGLVAAFETQNRARGIQLGNPRAQRSSSVFDDHFENSAEHGMVLRV